MKQLTVGQITAVLLALEGKEARPAELAVARRKLREGLMQKRCREQQRRRRQRAELDVLAPELQNKTNCTRCGGGGCVHCVGD